MSHLINNGDPPPGTYPFINADPNLTGLFQEILQTGGSIAFAVQCLVTVLSSMAYYDLRPLFNRTGSVDQQFSVIANIPVRHTGLSVAIGIQLVHFIVTVLVSQHTRPNHDTPHSAIYGKQ